MRVLSQKRFSIHQKVFFSFASILFLSILVTLLFGNSMMERLYIHSKSNDLSRAYHTIIAVMDKQENMSLLSRELWECLFEIEQNNIDILILTLEKEEEARIHYFTRKSWTFDNVLPQDQVHIGRRETIPHTFLMPEKFGPNQWIEEASALGIFQNENLPKLVPENNAASDGNRTMDYYGCYEKNDNAVYIFLRTPKEAVSLAAGLAVKYNLYIALATFLLMAITSYYISRRITQPIAEISEAANRISNMDFTKPLAIHTGDELELLSGDIDAMANKLQDYIYQLQLNQHLLEKDLQREAQTSQMRQEFIANVTHDFKTPLTLIRAYTETIRNQSPDDAERMHYCDIILNESERLNHMVTQLLQLSRLESGMVKLELSFFSMEELMREVLHRNQLLISNNSLTVHWEYDEEHIVQGDYIRIEQVVQNLIDNAIKYTPEQGSIWLSFKTEGELCRITVTNTCEALSAHQLENLFVSFYKTDESRHMEQQSFGLGLAIVKATMDLHKQTCTAYNTQDGLAVSFTLPLMQIEDDDLEVEQGEL